MTIGIYQITNKKTGQIYIGQSVNIERRFKEHISGYNCPKSYIDNAIQKYGKENFKFEIIEEFDKDTPFLNDVLNDGEQYYIAVYNTFKDNFHYNLTIGGDGTGFGENHPMYGKKHSEETKKKISEANSGENNPMYGKTGKNHPMYRKTGENHPMYEKKHTEETKKKISEANSGENNPMYGKKLSEETKKKMSEAHIGKKLSEETKKKISNSHIDKKRSEETKKKISESKIKKYARIIKAGKTSNNKQQYGIKYQGKIIKTSISIAKLKKWFAENYHNEQLILEFKK